jgi:NlpC/P60 family
MTLNLATIVTEAEKFVGAPYVYGGTSPTGWDCSGFVQYVLTHVGVSGVPRTSEQQWSWVTKIDKSQLQPGDLVFAQFPGDNASPGHVGIYVGNGKVLSAEDPAQGTNYDTLSDWGSAIVGYGRPPDASSNAPAGTGAGSSNPLSGLLDLGPQITGFFTDADKFVTGLMWLVSPGSWVRIVAFIAGFGLLLFAIHALIAAGNGTPLIKTPDVIPVPI